MPISIEAYLTRSPATSKEIQAATGLNQAAVSRQLRQMAARIIQVKDGRSPRYAITTNAFGSSDRLPLYMVDTHGVHTEIACIRPLAHGGYLVEPLAGMPTVLLGERKNGLYNNLPYFLFDLAPQGFLGRQIAEEMATQSPSFPCDPRHWTEEHIGRYLLSNGDDLPGNFKLGEQNLLRVKHNPTTVTIEDYPELAENVMNGILPGSSAGGEQPKFTAYCGDHSAHVIVKFSPKGEGAIAKRWRDILISEFHATEALRAANIPAAQTRLIEKGGRLFLESKRFDRVGEHGRISMLSLQYIDAEFSGEGYGWHRTMHTLHKAGLITQHDYYQAMILWSFGLLINNTDMHQGNLSLSVESDGFKMLPIYDMCSMGFAPKSGEVRPYRFSPPAIESLDDLDLTQDTLSEVKKMASDFWARVASDVRISNEFKAFLNNANT